MRSTSRSPLPPEVVKSHLEWIAARQSGSAASPALVTVGLVDSSPDIGVVAASNWADPSDGSNAIRVTLRKPNSRPGDTSPTSEWLFDPEGLMVLLAHVWFGGRVGLEDSTSNGAGNPIYHYASLAVPGARSIRAQRLIAGQRPSKLSKMGVDFHDLRRRSLPTSGQSKKAAVAQFGAASVKGGRYRTRADMIDAAVRNFRTGLAGELRSEADYRRLLGVCYSLLDAIPLGTLPPDAK